MTTNKTCTKCGSSKPLSAFGQQRGAPRAACKPCEADRTSLYRERGSGAGRVADAGGMSHQEIGRRLGIPKSTVQVIERRALRKFRAGAIRLGLRDAHSSTGPTYGPSS